MKKFFLILLFLSITFNAYAYSKSSALRIVKKHQKIAQAALDELDTEKAKKHLLKAISLIESYKLTNKEFANIYISAGVLNLMIEDGGEAVSYFKKALQLDPDIVIPENFSSDDVDAAFKKAKESSEKTDESFTFDTITYKIKYVAPKTHNKNKALDIKVEVTPLPPSGYDVQVMYMSKGSDSFESLNLTRSQDNQYIGVIPSLSIPDKELKLYILMIDDDLNPVTMFGSESKPIKIKITNSDSDEDLDLDLDEGEDNVSNPKKGGKRKIKKRINDNFPLLAFNFEYGTGVGIAHGKPKYTSLKIDPGLAWSPAWISSDLSFYITPDIMIGIISRIQVVEKTWNLALKGQTLVYNSGNYRLFTDFGAGYGSVKYRVDVSNAYPEQGNDIVEHGDIFLFGGVKFVFMFNKNIGFSSSSRVSLIVPNFSVLMDLGIGLYVEF